MVDRYTKCVLTVIAFCLVYFVGRDLISPAVAQGRVDVNISAVGGYPIGPANVSILEPALPVKLVR